MRAVIFAVFLTAAAVAVRDNDKETTTQWVNSDIYNECYNSTLTSRENLLPHTMPVLIEILRKIEDYQGLNMNIETLTTTILHRFRQDGIVKNPKIVRIVFNPYHVDANLAHKGDALIKKVIPNNGARFPEDSLTLLEKCTLHSMISSSIELNERGDETKTCRISSTAATRRYRRNVKREKMTKKMDDVENLTPEQIEMLRKHADEDPNSKYPAYSRNHPRNAKFLREPLTNCPVETGVIYTNWEQVSGGPIVAGIAAAMRPQVFGISKLLTKSQMKTRNYGNYENDKWDNKWVATFAGDIAETVLDQGPIQPNGVSNFVIGADGHWNSTLMPKWYFVENTENLQFTKAEFNGDLDGLILAQVLQKYSSIRGNLRLSQVLDMYYSDRGFFDVENRACNRRNLFNKYVSKEELVEQGYVASLLLEPGSRQTQAPTIPSVETVREFAQSVVDQIFRTFPGRNDPLACPRNATLTRPAVNLTIVIDTAMPFDQFQALVTRLLERVEVGKFNSNYKILNARRGTVMLETTNSISYLYMNISDYQNYERGFDFEECLKKLQTMKKEELDWARKEKWAGGKADAVVFIPYLQSSSGSDVYIRQTLEDIRTDTPDTVLLFLVNGNKNEWTKYVADKNIFSFESDVSSINTQNAIDGLANNIKSIPRRLINSECGSDYANNGHPHYLKDYVEPSGANYYSIHPNYFFTDGDDNHPKMMVKANTAITLCRGRYLLDVISQTNCRTQKEHTVPLICDEEIRVIHGCRPYFFAISANSSSTNFNSCQDSRCRFPDMIEYTVSFEELSCRSGAGTISATALLLLSLLSIYSFL